MRRLGVSQSCHITRGVATAPALSQTNHRPPRLPRPRRAASPMSPRISPLHPPPSAYWITGSPSSNSSNSPSPVCIILRQTSSNPSSCFSSGSVVHQGYNQLAKTRIQIKLLWWTFCYFWSITDVTNLCFPSHQRKTLWPTVFSYIRTIPAAILAGGFNKGWDTKWSPILSTTTLGRTWP